MKAVTILLSETYPAPLATEPHCLNKRYISVALAIEASRRTGQGRVHCVRAGYELEPVRSPSLPERK